MDPRGARTAPELELSEIDRLRARVEALLDDSVRSFSHFLSAGGRAVHRRARPRPLDASDSPSEPPARGDVDNATCTAFALHGLVASGVQRPSAGYPGPLGDRQAMGQLLDALAEDIVQGHPLDANDGASIRSSHRTDTAPLPNQYNSSIQVAGFLLAAHRYEASESLAAAREHVLAIADFLATMVLNNGGAVPSLPARSPAPAEAPTSRSRSRDQDANAYLTYWSSRAIQEAAVLLDRDTDRAALYSRSLLAVSDWSTGRLSELIAAHHAGLPSQFDVVQLVYCAVCVMSHNSRHDAGRLVAHAQEILFDRYYGNDGTLPLSAPVLADRHNFSLVVPTPEALTTLLLHGHRASLPFLSTMESTFEWLRAHRAGTKSWATRNAREAPQASAFESASSLAFLSLYKSALSKRLALLAADELGVQPYSLDLSVSSVQYPDGLGEIVNQHVLEPIGQGQRDLASMSMLLHGPPGTAKTTVVKRIAQDLQWPILLLDQGSFLHRGINAVEAEADRIFSYLYHLEDTVVVFDEIEEMVRAREGAEKEGRFLTTSMLPRIHNLRDRARIVFILITNIPDGIDEAVKRLGRIDVVFEVLAPDETARRSIVSHLTERFGLSRSAEDAFESINLVGLTESMTFGDIREIARLLALWERRNAEVTEDVAKQAVGLVRRQRQGGVTNRPASLNDLARTDGGDGNG